MKHVLIFILLSFYATPSFAEETMAACIEKTSTIHAGITRAEIETHMGYDGGRMGIFKGERLIFKEQKPDVQPDKEWWKQKACMVNIDFHPYGLSDKIYNDVSLFNDWILKTKWHPDPKDVVVRISAPFIDNYHFD